MTVIRPNSISGINSITANGGDINLFRADGTKADIPIVNNITAGVITATTGTFTGNLNVGGVLTYEDVTNVDSVGVITARLGINVVGNDLNVGSNIKIGNASGIITATSYRGDGSALTGVGASFGNSSINTSGIITATAFVPTTGQLSHRNLIINGAMTIAQRSTSITQSSGYGSVDRIIFEYGGIAAHIPQAQVDVSSGTTPYTLGFRKAFKITNGNQGSSLPTAGYISIIYKIEAQDIATSGWNYKSASSYVTLSFWVKASVAQNYYFRFQTKDGTSYNYPMETGSLTANTWTKITKTIPGNSNLQIDNDNGEGPKIEWATAWGTDSTSSSVNLNQWAAYSDGTKTPDQTTTWYTTNSATFEITGVQLEVGPVATPFEHRSIGEEFRRCQRYYQQYVNISAVGYVPNNSSRTYSHGFFFPVEMRAAPTMSITNTGSSNGQYITDGSGNAYVSSVLSQGSKTTHMSVSFNISTDLTDYRGAYLFGTGNTTYQTTYKIAAEL